MSKKENTELEKIEQSKKNEKSSIAKALTGYVARKHISIRIKRLSEYLNHCPPATSSLISTIKKKRSKAEIKDMVNRVKEKIEKKS